MNSIHIKSSMINQNLNNKRLIGFYDNLIKQHSPNSAKSAGWSDQGSQEIRFTILAQIGDLTNKSILDVGCGLGDLYLYLKHKFKAIDYTGIDIVPLMIKQAQQKFPDVNFIQLDFNQYQGKKLDYILASGALSYWFENYEEFYFKMIEKMFNQSKIAVGFNMLNSQRHPCGKIYATYSVPEVYEFCCGLTQKIVIYQDYSPSDFTFYL